MSSAQNAKCSCSLQAIIEATGDHIHQLLLQLPLRAHLATHASPHPNMFWPSKALSFSMCHLTSWSVTWVLYAHSTKGKTRTPTHKYTSQNRRDSFVPYTKNKIFQLLAIYVLPKMTLRSASQIRWLWALSMSPLAQSQTFQTPHLPTENVITSYTSPR